MPRCSEETDDVTLGVSMRWSYACSKALDEYLARAYHLSRGTARCHRPILQHGGPAARPAPTAWSSALRRLGAGRQAAAGVRRRRPGARVHARPGRGARAVGAHERAPRAGGEVVNIGGVEPVTILELARRIQALAGGASGDRSACPTRRPTAPASRTSGDADPDLTKLQELVGYRPGDPLDAIPARHGRGWTPPARALTALILVSGDEAGALGERALDGRAGERRRARSVRSQGGRGEAIRRFVGRVRGRGPRVVLPRRRRRSRRSRPASWARAARRARVVLDTGDATGALTRSTGPWMACSALAGARRLERAAYAVADTIVVRSERAGPARAQSMADRPVRRGARRLRSVPSAAVDGERGATALEDRRRSDGRRGRRLRPLERAPAVVLRPRRVDQAVAAARRRDVRGRCVLVRGDGLPHHAALARERGRRRPCAASRTRLLASRRGSGWRRGRGAVHADERRGGRVADHRQARSVHGGGRYVLASPRRRGRRIACRRDARRLSWGVG